MSLLDEALGYYNRGFSIFPCLIDKKPMIKWEKYQKERATEEQIRQWWHNGNKSPIAIVTGKISGVVVVDVDDVEIGFKNLSNYIPAGIETPTVKTPSGGYHLFFKYPDTEVRNNAKAIPGCDFRGEGGYVIASPSFCSYIKGSKRIEGFYVWEENKSINDLALNDLSPLYISFINTYVYRGDDNNKTMSPNVVNSRQVSPLFIDGKRDESLFHTANCLVKGYMPDYEIEQVLLAIMQSWGEHDEKWAMAKVKSAIERTTRRERNISEEAYEYIVSSTGDFLSSDIFKCLHLSSRQDQQNLSKVLTRFRDKKIIEAVGRKNGCWRKLDDSYEVMDIANASGKPIDKFRYPLGIEKYARTYPKNIITVNGFANQGKSAFVFEITRMNQKLFPGRKPRFLSSEAGVDEIKEKLSFYPQSMDTLNIDWWIKNIEFIERHDTWWDIIDPDGLNIIDYISDYQEAYKIPHYINEILKKLNKGVAVVVMQRDPAKMNSHGGQATRHAARLAIDIEFKKCVLTKVKGAIKHEPDYRHPDGIARNFELKDIWKINATSEWYWPEDAKTIENKKKYSDYNIKGLEDFIVHEED
jgi:hypothetical protein